MLILHACDESSPATAAPHARLIIEGRASGGSRSRDPDKWEAASETHPSVERVEDLSCDGSRGSAGNELFILNHLLTTPGASRALAEQANANAASLERARQCEAESGRLPDFVAVDVHDIGELPAAVDALNVR